MPSAVTETSLAGIPVRRGKVRDIYDLGDRLLLISTDRISAFDWVLPTPIPDKGRVLTQISAFWFARLDTDNHLLSLNLDEVDLPSGTDRESLEGRSMVVRKCEVVPIECVVRGYLDGSGWKEYQQNGCVCGVPLPAGLQQGAQLDPPIFTPATKEETGHDINISFDQMVQIVGAETAQELAQRSVDLYRSGAEQALREGIIIADTKFEWGWFNGRLVLIDEVLTPDSSRFWPSQVRGGPDRMCGARLPGWLGLERVPAEWVRLRDPPAPGTAARNPAGSAYLHTGHQRRNGPRHQHLVRPDGADRRR